MAFNRNAAKASIVTKEESDPDLKEVLEVGHLFQLELAKENNSHNLNLAKVNKGILGLFFGSESFAANFTAIVALLVTLIFAGYCGFQAGKADEASNMELWKGFAEKSLGFATLVVGFIFGRANSN